MKRKITFNITVGSHWPSEEEKSSYSPGTPIGTAAVFPVGGRYEEVTIEVDTEGENSMQDAEEALKKLMGNQTYHIWYWTWHQEEKDVY